MVLSSTKLVQDIEADLERFTAGEPTLDVENIRDLIAENQRLRAGWDEAQTFMQLSLEREERLRAALTEIMSMSEPAGYGERSKTQIRDVARRALGSDKDG